MFKCLNYLTLQDPIWILTLHQNHFHITHICLHTNIFNVKQVIKIAFENVPFGLI